MSVYTKLQSKEHGVETLCRTKVKFLADQCCKELWLPHCNADELEDVAETGCSLKAVLRAPAMQTCPPPPVMFSSKWLILLPCKKEIPHLPSQAYSS